MPRIYLKPQSAEYIEEGEKTALRGCDMPHCKCIGEYRAPTDRNLESYYWFCLDHVTEYNKAWNYFEGMAPFEIEDYIVRSSLWDRPTQNFSNYAEIKENLYKKAWQTYHNTDEDPFKQDKEKAKGLPPHINQESPEFQAMAIMGLEPPLDLKTIKKRYKELAKKYHPDLNMGDKKSEDLLKSINMAYTVLKLSYEKYEKIANPNT